MERKFAKLQRIDHDRRITKETDYAFLYQLQIALLLALREKGTLTAMQHRHAQESLQKQRRDRAKKLCQKEEQS